jgi:hypothetical protein
MFYVLEMETTMTTILKSELIYDMITSARLGLQNPDVVQSIQSGAARTSMPVPARAPHSLCLFETGQQNANKLLSV